MIKIFYLNLKGALVIKKKIISSIIILFFLITIFFMIHKDNINLKSSFNPNLIGNDIEQYLKNEEDQYSDLKKNVRKRIIWSEKKNTKTNISVVYIHGFSASSEEVRPLPDLIAKDINANIFYTRLTGHGRTSSAMGLSSISNWIKDLHEALEIGSRIGQKVILISTSTGGTLSAISALNESFSKTILGYIFISPNFGINHKFASLISWPYSEYWLHLVIGKTRDIKPRNELDKKFWTLSYPTKALIPMARLVKKINDQDFSEVNKPALFYFSMDDKVVEPKKTVKFIKNWGGNSKTINVKMSEFDDKYSHVIAGDILSPRQTEFARKEMVQWIKSLSN